MRYIAVAVAPLVGALLLAIASNGAELSEASEMFLVGIVASCAGGMVLGVSAVLSKQRPPSSRSHIEQVHVARENSYESYGSIERDIGYDASVNTSATRSQGRHVSWEAGSMWLYICLSCVLAVCLRHPLSSFANEQ